MKTFKIIRVWRYAVVDEQGRRYKRFYGADTFIRRGDAMHLKEELEQGKTQIPGPEERMRL